MNVLKKLKIIKDFYNETNCPGIIRTYGNMYEKIGKTEYKYYILMELAQIDWEKEINSRNKKIYIILKMNSLI